MNLEIRSCRPDELPVVIERINREFISSKQRVLSLAKRFQNTLSRENIEQIRVAISDGVLCGALSIKLFEWIAQGRAWHGAMVGMVWVDSRYRGKGIGSRLLSSAAQLLHDVDVDFGVLWTGTPTFYERAGWRLYDCGLFGEAVNHPAFASSDTVPCRPLVSVDATWLECLRSRSLPMRVVRSALDYCTVPIPATHVLCFSARSADGGEGYALVGEGDGVGYSYEMVADPSLWGIIWTAVTERFGQVYVNGCSDDPFAKWLAENKFVVWEPLGKAMWLRISDHVTELSLNAWHIPYFDWI